MPLIFNPPCRTKVFSQNGELQPAPGTSRKPAKQPSSVGKKRLVASTAAKTAPTSFLVSAPADGFPAAEEEEEDDEDEDEDEEEEEEDEEEETDSTQLAALERPASSSPPAKKVRKSGPSNPQVASVSPKATRLKVSSVAGGKLEAMISDVLNDNQSTSPCR